MSLEENQDDEITATSSTRKPQPLMCSSTTRIMGSRCRAALT